LTKPVKAKKDSLTHPNSHKDPFKSVGGEKLLQYLWQFQYFNKSELKTSKGERLEILFPGKLNTNQGPDFLDARIKIGNTTLVGSIELHLKTSHWNSH
jgi:hypothetical protein